MCHILRMDNPAHQSQQYTQQYSVHHQQKLFERILNSPVQCRVILRTIIFTVQRRPEVAAKEVMLSSQKSIQYFPLHSFKCVVPELISIFLFSDSEHEPRKVSTIMTRQGVVVTSMKRTTVITVPFIGLNTHEMGSRMSVRSQNHQMLASMNKNNGSHRSYVLFDHTIIKS
jgi:hypothetical protein